ncbi:PTS sugar transporter subunit IIA [Erysipelothrix sp. HDW6A]|uniref:PTS sugar transporter subunit IIA n=1 Tax=Erysipelothrix sp. HDW6A TaxID=2714928 RepID=UPI00140CD8B5|nr:PTS sugar transporter subunit IIA [Erysipelothrix sp. HDW6A]QIK57944.1 PTS sugar transporter subunit IIA [Erysipelothrix sp. HDW6A]
MTQYDYDIIIASHGSMAKGMAQSIEMILGEQESPIHYVGFELNESLESFNERITNEIQKIKEKNVLILTDIIGGTPTNVSLQHVDSNIHIVSGVHLALALDLFVRRNNFDSLTDLDIVSIIEESKKGILYLNDLI